MTKLVVFAGLPGTGKSSIARDLAWEIGAVWLRIDSIEQAIRDAGVVPGSLDDAGYRAAYAVAQDNLHLGRDVVADSVNPWMLTRNAWRDTGLGAGARVVEVEIVCTDVEEHRLRSETRANEVAGLSHPGWQAVIERDYHQWDRRHLTIDTAGRSVAACVERVRAALSASLPVRPSLGSGRVFGSPAKACPKGVSEWMRRRAGIGFGRPRTMKPGNSLTP